LDRAVRNLHLGFKWGDGLARFVQPGEVCSLLVSKRSSANNDVVASKQIQERGLRDIEFLREGLAGFTGLIAANDCFASRSAEPPVEAVWLEHDFVAGLCARRRQCT